MHECMGDALPVPCSYPPEETEENASPVGLSVFWGVFSSVTVFRFMQLDLLRAPPIRDSKPLRLTGVKDKDCLLLNAPFCKRDLQILVGKSCYYASQSSSMLEKEQIKS